MVEGATSQLIRAAWRKSSYSNAEGGQCVEAAPLTARVGVRDSKNPVDGALVLTSEQWRPFIERTKKPHAG